MFAQKSDRTNDVSGKPSHADQRGTETRSDDRFASKLEEIDTPWTQLNDAHQQFDLTRCQGAQEAILRRYATAIDRYLKAIAKDAQVAQDLAQEFAVRFLRGDFSKANRATGKFRSYLKRALHNLVMDHFRKQQRRDALTQQLWDQSNRTSAVEPSEWSQVDVDEFWRSDILRLAWSEFRKENSNSTTPYFDILRLRTEHPDISIDDLAKLLPEEKLAARSAASLRKILSRARKRFSEILWQEVARSCGSFEDEYIEQELCELGLRKYFQRFKTD